MYLAGRDYYDQGLRDKKNEGLLNNMQDTRQEEGLIRNALHPRVALLKNSNIEKDKKTRRVHYSDTEIRNYSEGGDDYPGIERSPSRMEDRSPDRLYGRISPTRNTDYDGHREQGRQSHKAEQEQHIVSYNREHRYKGMSPSRQTEYGRMSPNRQVEYGRMSPSRQVEYGRMSPSRQGEYGRMSPRSHLEYGRMLPEVTEFGGISPGRSIDYDDKSSDYHRYQSPSPCPRRKYLGYGATGHRSRRDRSFEEETFRTYGFEEEDEEFNA